MKLNLEKQPKAVCLIHADFDQADIAKAKQEALKYLSEEKEYKGFRKGRTPLEVVEKNTNENVLKEYIVNQLATLASVKAVQENKLQPIISPQATVEKFSWEEIVLNIQLVEQPPVTLGDYKDKIKEALEKKSPAGQIAAATTLAEAAKEGSSDKEYQEPALTFPEIIEAIKQTCHAEVADILIEKEMNSRLGQLVNRIEALGMRVEQYLESQNKNIDQLRQEYRQQAKETLEIEFIMQEIAQKEGHQVTDQDVADAIQAAPDEKSRKEFESEDKKEYIRTVLKRSKTLLAMSKGQFVN